jgi:hypothetical protein
MQNRLQQKIYGILMFISFLPLSIQAVVLDFADVLKLCKNDFDAQKSIEQNLHGAPLFLQTIPLAREWIASGIFLSYETEEQASSYFYLSTLVSSFVKHLSST